MTGERWRIALPHRAIHPVERSWLVEPGSLTARCLRNASAFRVRLLDDRLGAALPDEAAAVNAENGQKSKGQKSLCRVREVTLECDGVPVIFAHTILPESPRGRLSRWMARLGSRSLGSLLFAFPGFVRGPLEFRRLDARHPLYRQAAGFCEAGKHLWARRSLHMLDGQRVLVTEVFLPEIRELRKP